MRTESSPAPAGVLTLADVDRTQVVDLLDGYGLTLVEVADGVAIPGSYWGDPEAGLIGCQVHARSDTPVHSLLHEAAHLIVLPADRRALVHTDATDSVEEEDAVCYLQIILADRLERVGRDRLMRDMDTWGYTFRLGSTKAWFGADADNARSWLIERDLLPDTTPDVAAVL